MNKKTESEIFQTRSDVEATVKTVVDVFDSANKIGINVLLFYGALLGMVRENRLLPWNNDVELACLYEDTLIKKFKILTDDLNDKGYFAVFYSTIGAIAVHKPGYKVSVNLNIFWIKDDLAIRPHEPASSLKLKVPLLARFFWWCAYFSGAYTNKKYINKVELGALDKTKLKIITLFRIFPLTFRRRFIEFFHFMSRKVGAISQKTAIPLEFLKNHKFIDFYGTRVSVPFHAEKLLSLIYGDDWNFPKDDWSFYVEENKKCTRIKFLNECWEPNLNDLI